MQAEALSTLTFDSTDSRPNRFTHRLSGNPAPWGKGGFEISFSGSAIFRFVPAGPPTTDRRPMRDEQGRLWLMSGHHSFTLEEQGGFKNRISVSSDPVRPTAR